jgi:predicted alpha/beta hydrolase family esterase
LQSHLLQDWLAYQSQYPVARANALRQLLAPARYHAPRMRPDPSMRVLASLQDRLVDYRCAQQLADHWVLACYRYPAAGHDLVLDDDAWAAQKAALWMAQNAR